MEITINIPGLFELAMAVDDYAKAIAAHTADHVIMHKASTAVATPAPAATQAVPASVQAAAPAPNPAPAVTPTVPTATTAYTLEQLAVAATQLVDAGRRSELVQLLSTYGVAALTALPKEHYGAFATALRGMGAKI